MSSPVRKRPARDEAPYCAILATPFAWIGIRTHDDCLVRVDYLPDEASAQGTVPKLAREVCRQIEAYLADARFQFDLPCAPQGTPFQHRVWQGISTIASGSTLTYGELAQRLKSAARPVGAACGSNPIPLIVPCHRVVAAGGGLGGFMHTRSDWSLEIKRWLLRHEVR